MVGRERELARLDALLDEGGALVVRGPRGIGVSALLEAAAERAAERGLAVLRAAGVEAECTFPYAGLHQLLRPLRRAVRELPGAPGDALRASFGFSEDGDVPDPALVARALVALARDAAPGVVCVDDWQWVDAESRAAITAFADASTGVPVVLGGHGPVARAGEVAAPGAGWPDDGARAEPGATPAGVAWPGVDELVVGPLDPVAAAALLPSGLPLLVRERVLREAEGRPLALVELPVAYADARDGDVLGSWAPLTPVLADTFADGLDRLGPACAQALLVAALDDGGRVEDVLAAASRLAGRRLSPDVLADAVALGFVVVDDDRVAFTHPLTRAAVRRASSPAARAAGHEAFASVVAATDPDRATWHRVIAAPGLDETLAGAFEAVSLRSRAAGDFERAAAGLRRAANLTPSGRERSRRLVLAAELAAEIGGVEIAGRLLDEVVAAHLDATGRARVLALRPRVAPAALADAARAATDPGLALRLWWRAATETQALGGDGAALAREAVADGRSSSRPEVERSVARSLRGYLAFVDGDAHAAVALLERAAHELRAQRRRTRLGQVLAMLAHARLTVSQLDGAWRDGQASAELCAAVRQPLWGALARTALARVAALRGHDTAGEQYAAAAERVALRVRGTSVLALVQHARGSLALGAGRPAEAFAHLRRPFDPTDPAHDPGTAPTLLDDLAEAATTDEERAFVRATMDAQAGAVRGGQTSSAKAGGAAVDAQGAGSPGRRGALARAHAELVLADDADADAAFARAAAIIGADTPFAHARMLLVHGMRLRRQRRPADSREPLRAAVARFESLGAAPWAEKAQRELAATAETANRGDTTLDTLTPRELEIARLAARGLTNPAIAADLALSPKTVGHHLARIFPKLEISSRANLGAALERHGY